MPAITRRRGQGRHRPPTTPGGKWAAPGSPMPGGDGGGRAAARPTGRQAGSPRPRRLPRPPLGRGAATEPPAPWLRLLPLSILNPMLPTGPGGAVQAGARLGGNPGWSPAAGGRGGALGLARRGLAQPPPPLPWPRERGGGRGGLRPAVRSAASGPRREGCPLSQPRVGGDAGC